MAVIGSGVAVWMPLLDAIHHVQAVTGGSIKDAAAAGLAALQSGAVPARRSGPENTMPLDGRYERWNGELAPQAWHLATIHDDGTVSFDTSEGSPPLRRALHHAIQVRHEVEVGQDAVLQCFSATTENSKPPTARAAARDPPDVPLRSANRTRPGPIPTAPRIIKAAESLLASGKVPGKMTSWKEFRSEVCQFLKVPESQRGYSLDSVRNAVRPLLQARQKNNIESTESTER
jgi:hypothetical protein